MQGESTFTRQDFEDALARLREDIRISLQKTEDHLMTALFGFVNSASARMSALEAEDLRLMKRIGRLEERLDALERVSPRTG